MPRYAVKINYLHFNLDNDETQHYSPNEESAIRKAVQMHHGKKATYTPNPNDPNQLQGVIREDNGWTAHVSISIIPADFLITERDRKFVCPKGNIVMPNAKAAKKFRRVSKIVQEARLNAIKEKEEEQEENRRNRQLRRSR